MHTPYIQSYIGVGWHGVTLAGYFGCSGLQFGKPVTIGVKPGDVNS